MAIIPESQYPGKITPASTEYPYGKARNITLPGDGAGTPWEAALVNDLFGFQQALLGEAEIVPSGDPETATESQYLEAAKKVIGGNKTIYVGSVAELEALSLAERVSVELTDDGVSGRGVVKSGSHPADPQKGAFIDLANGNYWHRDIDGELSVEWFGAKDGLDGSEAAQAAYDLAYLLGDLYRSDGGSRNFNTELINAPTVYWPAKSFGLSREIVVPYGVKTRCEKATRIFALTSGMRMIRSITSDETPAAGLRGFDWENGIIAGNNLARRGLCVDTTLNGDGIRGLKISGVNHYGTDRTLSSSVVSGDTSATLNDASGLSYGDVLYHEGTGQFFLIESVTGNDITIPALAEGIGSGATLKHVPVGFQSQSAQEFPIYNLNVTRCGLGAYIGSNAGGRASASLSFYHPWVTWNDYGVCWNTTEDCRVFGGGLSGSTFGSDITHINCDAQKYHQVHIEPSRFTDDPDLGGSAANKTAMESVPIVRNLSGDGITINGAKYAANTSIVGFRRFCKNSADEFRIVSLNLGGEAPPEDPNYPGVRAIVEQADSLGSTTILDVLNTGQNFADPNELITDGAGGLPSKIRYYCWIAKLKASNSSNPNSAASTGGENVYASATTEIVSSVTISGESFPRLKLRANGWIDFGTGASDADATLRWRSPGAVGTSNNQSLFVDGEWNNGPLRMGNFRLWVDALGNLRIKNGPPASDTDGQIVGDQTL